jgi:hypothetical protein
MTTFRKIVSLSIPSRVLINWYLQILSNMRSFNKKGVKWKKYY